MNTLPPNVLRKISTHLNANSLANLRESHRGGRNAVTDANVRKRLVNRALNNVLNEINFWNRPPKHRYLNYRTTPQQFEKIRKRNARVYTNKVSKAEKLRMVREILRKVPTTGPGKATQWRMGLIHRINELVGPVRAKVRLPGRQEFAISAPNKRFYRVT